jgi:fibrillarin-like rRNA methylase
MKDVVEDCKHSIEKEGLQILETHILAPYDEEHACIVVRC